jgi:hypothetical protein
MGENMPIVDPRKYLFISECLLTDKSPHWPGIGRYVGSVDDEKPILFDTGYDFSKFDYYDTKPWQSRRVYMDEVPNKKDYSNLETSSLSINILERWAETTAKMIRKFG